MSNLTASRDIIHSMLVSHMVTARAHFVIHVERESVTEADRQAWYWEAREEIQSDPEYYEGALEAGRDIIWTTSNYGDEYYWAWGGHLDEFSRVVK